MLRRLDFLAASCGISDLLFYGDGEVCTLLGIVSNCD